QTCSTCASFAAICPPILLSTNPQNRRENGSSRNNSITLSTDLEHSIESRSLPVIPNSLAIRRTALIALALREECVSQTSSRTFASFPGCPTSHSFRRV